jgi:hypothetical protein
VAPARASPDVFKVAEISFQELSLRTRTGITSLQHEAAIRIGDDIAAFCRQRARLVRLARPPGSRLRTLLRHNGGRKIMRPRRPRNGGRHYKC